MLGGTDKDFKTLNKVALKSKATTAHQQYQYRSGTDLRLRDPTETIASKTFYKTFNRAVDEDTTYGKALSPSTPIKEVMSNYFGEIGELMIKNKYEHIDSLKSIAPRLLCHKRDTKASSLARAHIITQQVSVSKTLSANPSDLFKMKKFQNVPPRTNTFALKRPTTQLAGETRNRY